MASTLQKNICKLCKSHYLYFMSLNTFFSERVHRFHQTRKGPNGIQKLRNLTLYEVIA